MKIFFFSRPILALLSVCAFCYAPLSAQTLDSTKIDSVQKPSENWYWISGSIGVGLGADVTSPFSAGILTGGDASFSVAWQSSILSVYIRGGILLTGQGRGGALGFVEPYSVTYGVIERTDTTFHSTSFGLGRFFSFNDDIFRQISVIGELQAGAKTNGIGVGWRLRGCVSLSIIYVSIGFVLHLGWVP